MQGGEPQAMMVLHQAMTRLCDLFHLHARLVVPSWISPSHLITAFTLGVHLFVDLEHSYPHIFHSFHLIDEPYVSDFDSISPHINTLFLSLSFIRIPCLIDL